MAKIGINFRATSGYVTDSADQDYSLGSTTGRSLNGFTHRWLTAPSQTRDRSLASNNVPELAGMNGVINNITPREFEVTLPATGDYIIRMAIGDTFNAAGSAAYLYDNTTLLDTIFVGLLAQNTYVDASGTTRTSAADWKTNNASITRTFASTSLRIRLGGNSGLTTQSTIAHLYVESVSSGAAGPVLFHSHYQNQGWR